MSNLIPLGQIFFQNRNITFQTTVAFPLCAVSLQEMNDQQHPMHCKF